MLSDNEQNEYLVHEYVRENFVSRGMCADIAIHEKADEHNTSRENPSIAKPKKNRGMDR